MARMRSDESSLRGVAVVVPFGGGIEALTQQLEALEAQTGECAFEVIISCNRLGLADALKRETACPRRFTLRIIDSSEFVGPGHARNAGWRLTAAELIVFCDADDLVSPDWLRGHVDALKRHDLSRGAIVYDKLNEHGVNLGRHDGTQHPTIFHHLPFSPSCSLGATRRVLELVNGFDRSLRSGEDIDLCWRAQYLGASLGFAEHGKLDYRMKDGFSVLYRQGLLYGAGDVELLRRHEAFGARHSVGDTISDVFRVAFFGLAALARRPGARQRFATRLGTSIGRVRASITSGTLII
ncbi:hypothetical protein C5B94_01410 [Clavibacter michiganensis]|nr:hypothetical protein C5B94_01410 [Clavibacter michiganensis]